MTHERLLSGLIALTLAVAVAAPVAGEPGAALRAALIGAPAALTALSLLLYSAAHQSGPQRLLLACGVAAYAAGAAAYGSGILAPQRFPSLVDAGLLLHVGTIVFAIHTWRRYLRRGVGTLWVDAVIAGLAAAAVGGWLMIDQDADGAAVDRVLFAGADLFVAGCMLAAGAVSRWPPTRRAVELTLALVLLAIADAAFASQLADGHVRPSRFVLAAWPAGLVLLGAAVRRRFPPARPAPSAANFVLPTLAAAAALPPVIVRGPFSPVGIIAAAALLSAGVRLTLSLTENVRLLEIADASAARQAVIAHLGHRALEGASIEELIGEGTRAAARLLRADAAVFSEVRPDGKVHLRATPGAMELLGRDVAGETIAPSGAMLAATRTGEPVVIVDDWETETRFRPSAVVAATGTRSLMTVAFRRAEGSAWAVTVLAREPRAFDEAGAAFLQSIGSVLVTAAERLETDAAIRDLATARERLVVDALEAEQHERQRISEVLHDTALQELLAAGQDLDDALRALDGPDLERAQRARSGVARAARDLRDAVTELHPVVLQHAGLGPAIAAVAQRQAARAGFTYELDLDETAGAEHEELVLSLVRELMNNVAHHAEARSVHVSLNTTEEGVVLEVRDDGRGIDTGRIAVAAADGHIGLASWTARVEALGGTLSVRSGGNGGTVARATLPHVLAS